MSGRYDAERLFEALRFLRDQTPGEKVTTERMAHRALLEEVPPVGRAELFDAIDEEDYQEACATVCFERIEGRDFRGETVGEAVTFIRTCVRRRYFDKYRARTRFQDLKQRVSEKAPPPEVVPAPDSESLADAVAQIERLAERVLAQAGHARRHRVSVWLDARLGRLTEPIVPRDHPDFERQQVVLYQQRSVGRRYAAAAVEELRAQGQLDDIDPEIIERLVSAPRGLRRRPGNA